MSSFTSASFHELGIDRKSGRKLYRTETAFTFDIGYLGSGLTVRVPAGFVTDGASVPRWMYRWRFIRDMLPAAAVHDLMRQDLRYSKLAGDAVFLTALSALGTPPIVRELAFIAVRLNNGRGASALVEQGQ